MRIDGRDERYTARFKIVDARTGLAFDARRAQVLYADDEQHILGIVTLDRFLQGASAIDLHVPRVVIDMERHTVLFNVGVGAIRSVSEALEDKA